MFGGDLIEKIEKKITPALEKSKKMHRVSTVLNAATQLYAAEKMRGAPVDQTYFRKIIKETIEHMNYIESELC